ncbi:hypothetical protein ROA7745_04431 [Roseovarius aestuarii]|uniref:Uncharacterized protein n=1 Tax=Roseovarius aestuarii TaxID=475083 RepID=A0A1X7BYA5_9RHOB|nr:hypothetical protein ROA7745_04431 [Roseovarius aestuarii]
MIVTSANVRERTVAWAYLYAITSSMFEYARNETRSLDETVTETEIRSAINTAGDVSMYASDFTGEIGLYARTFQRRFEA